MASPFVLGVGAVLFAVGVVFLGYALRGGRRALAVLRTPATSLAEAIRSGEQSYVRGTASVAGRDGETVTGPFSGHEALVVGYAVRELRYQTQGTGRPNFQKSWQTIEEHWTGVPFELDDGSAGARVEPGAADTVLAVDQRTKVKGGRRPPERIAAFIEDSGTVGSEERHYRFGPIKLSAGNDRRYIERRIEPGDEVSVFGRATAVDGPTDGSISGGDPYVLSDAPRGRTGRRLLRGSLPTLAFGLALSAVGAVVFGLGL